MTKTRQTLPPLDRAALTQLYNDNYDLVYRTIAFRVGDPQMVEDLTNEVFARLLAALKKKRVREESYKGWLLTVSRNVVADYYRKQKRWNMTQLTDQLQSADQTPEQQVDKQIRMQRVAQAVAKLPESQQEVLALRFGAGMRIREVAAYLNKSLGAVKMLQARAITRLASELEIV